MRRSYYFLLLAFMGLLLLILGLVSVVRGNTSLALDSVLAVLLQPFAAFLDLPSAEPTVARIVLDLRLPRVLLTFTVGAGLAIVGVLLQTATRNDLADPFLFGLSAGASAGAVTVITLSGDWLGVWSLPLAAMAGGLLAAAVVLALVYKSQAAGPQHLVLAGLAASFLFGALTHYLVFAGNQRAAHSVLFWSLGGMGSARWDNIGLALWGLGLLALFAVWRCNQLDALLTGDATAHSLGVAPARLRFEIFTVSALATASFVALSGVIGFVGLMVPHLARALSGALHGRLLCLSALIGASLLTISDLASRTLLPAQELPIGILTGAVGAVFVLALVLRSRSTT